MSPSELMGAKMLGLLSHPRAGRLQATAIALACMGVFSGPDGATCDVDLLNTLTDIIEANGCFPLRTLEDCVSAFDAALIAYAGSKVTL